ncbi:MAG: 2-octaprenyl-6-methoxyphenyl hydroxylase [Xanthomonadales bacterium]|jgi:2-octaprenyl-6-methoxyphenol hydroxylase|nr:2-octaprenyl-6-methoxyphenyl hydroxylase [Xanthomonadales bacterium]
MAKQRNGPGYDVAIVGGGLVGASLACALSPLGLRVALIEAVPFRAETQPSYDDRTLALSASSCAILEGLGLWPKVAARATPIREIQVRELNRPGRVLMQPEELGLDRFGHVLEARAFGAALAQTLPGLEGLDVFCPASLDSIEFDEGECRLELVSGGEPVKIHAALTVGADGAESFVRESLGIECERHDYGQSAVICNVTPEEDHRGRAFELFTPSGPMAVMPHEDGRCGLIWCVPTAAADALLEWPDAEFMSRANARFGRRLGRFIKVGRRSAYALRLVRAREDIRPRTVILGNAAHAIHPVGAQGFNLGLRDAAVLAEVLADGMQGDDVFDAGSWDLLCRYSAWRKPDHDGTIAYSDGLARIYANPTGAASIGRLAGLLAHAFVPSLRRRLAVRSMGFRGQIPRLARGETL